MSSRASIFLRSVALVAAFASASIVACDKSGDASPFFNGLGGGSGSASAGGAGGSFDAGPDADPTLGGPCVDDGQCDDQLDCTHDRCDQSVGRCRFTPDDAPCQDGVYCNGAERCDQNNGCVLGDPISCDDMDECTIDQCIEATHACTHVPRDADGDGDPDEHCGGGDCDDNDPTVNSKTAEICGNGKDDNCNGQIDESPCSTPTNDTCADPLVVTAAGFYSMTTFGAMFDYPTSCAPMASPGSLEDVVAALELMPGPPIDVIATARIATAKGSIAAAGQCGDPSSELGCGASFPTPAGDQIAKIRLRGVGDQAMATTIPIYVTTAGASAVTLGVDFEPATTKPTNETCGTAAPITPGVPVTVPIVDATIDLASACAPPLGELVYSFDVAATSDIDLYASSSDGDGIPVISLRDAGCALPEDELTCAANASAHVKRHAAAPGTYYVAVSATAPTDVALTLALSSPTALAGDETCVGSPAITPNTSLDVDLTSYEDDVDTGCVPGAVDAAYDLSLANASDVLLVERISSGDTAAVELAGPACDPSSLLACTVGGTSPIRASHRNVPAGDYRVVSESVSAQPTIVTALVRDAVPTTLVPFADACADVQKIPATGGFFQGNTANAIADFEAGCDSGGQSPNGAPDQLLELDLTEAHRVVLDMGGSSYTTILDVRQGPTCPGTEVPFGCAVGYQTSRSFLDLELAAGTYFIQIDGYALAAGPWQLDVRVVDPAP